MSDINRATATNLNNWHSAANSLAVEAPLWAVDADQQEDEVGAGTLSRNLA